MTTGTPSAAQMQARFEQLQERLVDLWASMHEMSPDPQTIVVVPSLSIELLEGSGIIVQPYEERYLFLLFLLRQPLARMIYVTSEPIRPSVVDYYLSLVPDVPQSHARRRLSTVALGDASSRPLSAKLLERPRVLERIRELIPDPRRAHLVPFVTTDLERDLTVHLGIPMYGADPKFVDFGTKSGGRRLFEEEGVSHPLGVEDLHTVDDVVDAVVAMRARKPSIAQVLVKLNEGVSGDGNALVDLAAVPAPGDVGERVAVEQAVRAMQLEAASTTFATYEGALRAGGGIVEERIQGREFTSPSVQMRASPLGELELLSTHDQLLGGKSGQAYLGCVFPANPEYAPLITAEAARIGRRLVDEGVLGRFALDFVAVKDSDDPAEGTWAAYAIEINCARAAPRIRSSRCSTSPTVCTTPSARRSPCRLGSRSSSWPATTWTIPTSAVSPPTTCSTSRCATACTTTRRPRPAACSTCSRRSRRRVTSDSPRSATPTSRRVSSSTRWSR